jgi:hypothetical protein
VRRRRSPSATARPAPANGPLLCATPNNGGHTHRLQPSQIANATTAPKARPRRATCSRRPTPNWSTTVARLSHTASQLHAQDRITPRSLHAIHNHRCSAVATSPCQPRPRIARSPPVDRHFYSFTSFALTRNAKIRGSKF